MQCALQVASDSVKNAKKFKSIDWLLIANRIRSYVLRSHVYTRVCTVGTAIQHTNDKRTPFGAHEHVHSRQRVHISSINRNSTIENLFEYFRQYDYCKTIYTKEAFFQVVLFPFLFFFYWSSGESISIATVGRENICTQCSRSGPRLRLGRGWRVPARADGDFGSLVTYPARELRGSSTRVRFYRRFQLGKYRTRRRRQAFLSFSFLYFTRCAKNRYFSDITLQPTDLDIRRIVDCTYHGKTMKSVNNYYERIFWIVNASLGLTTNFPFFLIC